MSHTEPLDRLAKVVHDLLLRDGFLGEDGKATREAERKTGISRSTLDRKLTSGDFNYRELVLIARALGIKTSAITRAAEVAA